MVRPYNSFSQHTRGDFTAILLDGNGQGVRVLLEPKP